MEEIKYMKRRFDTILIASTLAKIAFDTSSISLNQDETYVLEALKRSNSYLADMELQEIGAYLEDMSDDQLLGLANNVKGILHEMQFVELENSDGDNITAALFPDTNHQGTDILLTDNVTGEIIEVQLKATASINYVEDWIEKHPEGEIIVSEEIAEKMGLDSSGISNEELTVQVEDFVDELLILDDKNSLWDYFPALPAISISMASFFLLIKLRKGEIDFQTFKIKFLRLTGIKLAKFALFATLMLIPVVNVVVGTALIFHLLYGTAGMVNRYFKSTA